jgi:hypothetical protein
MKKIYTPFLVLGAIILMSGSIGAQSVVGTDSVVIAEAETTSYYRAVFAHYLAVIPNEDPSLSVNSAVSVSNVCAVPDELSFLTGTGPTTGSVAVVLYDQDGSVTTYTTTSDVIGTGLNSDGTLGPGQTWTVNLSEVLAAALAVDTSEIEFAGYGWFLAGFDCLAGTYSNTIYGLGFTQNFEMMPAMGQGGWFGGVMIPQEQ